MKFKFLAVALLAAVFATEMSAQQQLTKEQILNMSIEELSELPLEDLMQAVETLGVSSVDELFAMIMNKNVSSASKKEEDSFTSPLSSTVITRDEMRTYGISTIEEAFRLIPGMIVTEKTNGVYDIHMRGLNNIPDNNMFLYTENANTLIMIDGRPVQNYAMGAVNFDMVPIDIEDVERIEVVRGACSALYGANAVSGVINIITEKPTTGSKLISGDIQVGSQSTYVGNIALRKAFNDKFAAGVTFNMQYRERPTNKLYVIPQAGVYVATNSQAMPAPGVLVNTPYAYGSLGADGVLSLNGVGSIQLDENKQPVMSTLDLEDGVTPADFQNAIGAFMGSYQNYQQIFGSLEAVNEGKYCSVSELGNIKQIYPVEYDENGNVKSFRLFNGLEPETPANAMFEHPEIARKTLGLNGYLRFTPNSDIAINLMGGYQNSLVNTTPVGDDYFSFNGRASKTYYVALDANVYGLKFLANYSAGPQDYAVGVPGFKVYPKSLNISAEYDFNFDFGLSVRPGISYQNINTEDYTPVWANKQTYKWKYEDPGYRYDSNDKDHLSGFFNYTCKMTTFAPSIRLDYKVGDLRLIGAFREDKTNIPDKWTPSWQFAANYSINDNNFVRVVYGRANRGTNMVSSGANFEWTRTSLVYPSRLHFSANDDPSLVKIDNVELGYRTKPSNKLLIDAELFYSKSSGYGALMAYSASMNISPANKNSLVAYLHSAGDALLAQVAKGEGDIFNENMDKGLILEPYASIRYNNLPYDVKQFGLSFNVDYIISSKLIAKLNANFQKTTIDNYYQYSQTADIQKMLGVSTASATEDFKNAVAVLIKSRLVDGKSLDESIESAFVDYHDAATDWLKFGAAMNEQTSSIEKENGHAHKATPSFYGMLGLIYKPVQKLEVAAFANFVGKRTYQTKYGADELDNRCTANLKVGYKPMQNFELFVNAHNLFNTKDREFTCSDEIGGVYTVGVNFGF